jgi:hypothetical protein
MPLKEREEELYHRDYDEEPVRISPRPQKKVEAEPPLIGEKWGKVEITPEPPQILRPGWQNKLGRMLRIVIIAGILLGVVAAVGFAFLRWWSTPSVTVAVEGPSEVRAGDKYSFEIVVQNSSRGTLERTSLTLRAGSGVLLSSESGQPLSERVRRKDFDQDMESGSLRKETFSAYFLGKEGDERQIEVSFRYRLPNVASDFTKTATLKVKIAAPAVALNLSLPKQTLSSSNFTFGYELRNLSELNIRFLTAEIKYPEDFSFVEARPTPNEGAKWQFSELASQNSDSITVVGRLAAAAGEFRTFRAALYSRVWGEEILLGETNAEIAIIENPLLMAISVNGATEYAADPGQYLEYRITFRNNFQEPLKDVVIVAKLSGRMFDFQTLKTDGAFDSRDFTVTFHGGNTPQLLFLGPQEAGSVAFSIRTLSTIPDGIRNPTISVKAEMSSGSRPRYLGVEGPVRASASIESKISGLTALTSNVLLRDPVYGGGISGSWPLRANQTTQMSVHLNVKTMGNDLENVLISTILPSGVSYLGNARGDSAGLVANPRTSRIEWQISRLPAYQERELIFQVGVTPSVTNIGTGMNILQSVSLVGTDSFTGKRVELSTPGIRSTDLKDPTILNPSEEGKVRE